MVRDVFRTFDSLTLGIILKRTPPGARPCQSGLRGHCEADEGNGGVSLASRVRALNWPLTHEAG